MRLVALTALVMAAFAANSVLNRAAVGGAHISSLDFAWVRLLSGAVVLAVAASLTAGQRWLTAFRVVNIGALALYAIGFSLAYIALPAGAGALILFAAVQVTMFVGAVIGGEAVPARRWIGSALALLGLSWMLWPGEGGVSVAFGALMAFAGFGWGVYSLRGRAGGPPLDTTAASFVGAVPLALAARLVLPAPATGADAWGIALAVLSGAVTSGLGYAAWYSILPSLGATRAALAQLTVPVIAVLGGVLLLEEALTLRLALSCLIVVGGVALGLSGGRRS